MDYPAVVLEEDLLDNGNPFSNADQAGDLLPEGEQGFLGEQGSGEDPRRRDGLHGEDLPSQEAGAGGTGTPPLLSPDTPLDEAIRRCLEVYYLDQEWNIPFPEHAGAPLLYIPKEVQELRDDPDCLGVMQSEVDMLSHGVMDQIPLGYYPIKVEELQQQLEAAANTQENIRRMQERLMGSGQLPRVTWKPEEVNPGLEKEDLELLDTDIDQRLEAQRETPSLGQLIQRPMYTEASGGTAAQRHVARLARLYPEPVRQYLAAMAAAKGSGERSPLSPFGTSPLWAALSQGMASPSPSPSPAPYRGGPSGWGGDTSGISSVDAAAAAGDSDDPVRQWLAAKKRTWSDEVWRTFRVARALEHEFLTFIQFLAEKKLGLDAGDPAHVQLTVELWKAVGEVGQMHQDVGKQACVWGRICQLSYEYEGPTSSSSSSGKPSLSIAVPPSGDGTTLLSSGSVPPPATGSSSSTSSGGVHRTSTSGPWIQHFRELKLPHFLTVWRPLMQRYRAALDQYILSGGPKATSGPTESQEKGRQPTTGEAGKGGTNKKKKKKNRKGVEEEEVEEGSERRVGDDALSAKSPEELDGASGAGRAVVMTLTASSSPVLEVLAARREKLEITKEEFELGTHLTGSKRTGRSQPPPLQSQGSNPTEEAQGVGGDTNVSLLSSSSATSSSSSTTTTTTPRMLPVLKIGERLKRHSNKLFFRAQGVPIYPISVTPVFPSGFEEAAAQLRALHVQQKSGSASPSLSRGKEEQPSLAGSGGTVMGMTPTPPPSCSHLTTYPEFDFLAEDANGVAHLILPGAVIPEKQCAEKGPHVLVHDRTLLCADADGLRDLMGESHAPALGDETAVAPLREPFSLGATETMTTTTTTTVGVADGVGSSDPWHLDPRPRKEDGEPIEEGVALSTTGARLTTTAATVTTEEGPLVNGCALLYHALPQNTFEPLDVDEDNTSSYLFHFFSPPSSMVQRSEPRREDTSSHHYHHKENPHETRSTEEEADHIDDASSSQYSTVNRKRLPTRQEIRERQTAASTETGRLVLEKELEESLSTSTSYHPIFSSTFFTREEGTHGKQDVVPNIMKAAKRGAVGIDGSVLTYSRIGGVRKYQKTLRTTTLPMPQHYAILFSSHIEPEQEIQEEEEETQNDIAYHVKGEGGEEDKKTSKRKQVTMLPMETGEEHQRQKGKGAMMEACEGEARRVKQEQEEERHSEGGYGTTTLGIGVKRERSPEEEDRMVPTRRV